MKTLHAFWLSIFFICLYSQSYALQGKDDTKKSIIYIPTQISKNIENVKYLTVNDGFSRNSVFQVIQDEKGYMWFGLWDGLYRYDGNELQHVLPTSKHKNSNQSINVLLCDGKNNIWIGTSSGLLIWDAARKQKVAFKKTTEKGDSVIGPIYDMHKDKHNNIWIVNKTNQLYIYNQTKDELKDLSYLIGKPIGAINKVYIDRYENIWLATNGAGVVQLNYEKPQSSNPFDAKTWKVTSSPLFKGLDKDISILYQDSDENYWVGNNKGIYQIQMMSNDTLPTIYKYENHHKDLPLVKVRAFAEVDNTLYAATNQGLFTYNFINADAVWNLPQYTEERHLNDRSLTDICIDRENGIWISSFYGGVNYIHPTSSNFSPHIDLNKYIEGHVISAITEDKNGNIWMAVEDNGVCMWNRKNNTITNFNNSSNTDYHPSFSNVQGIYADGDYVYIGMSRKGMDIVNINTLQRVKLHKRKMRPDRLPNNVYAFQKLSQNTILIGALNGLYRFNTQNNNVYKIPDVEGKVTCIAKDEFGDLWVSTVYKGFYWYSEKKNKWWHFMQDTKDSTKVIGNSISTILALNPTVYIGTQGNGLWEFNRNTHEFRQLATKTFKDAIIFKILQDNENLWISTNQGLYVYNMQNQSTKQFTVRDGLRSNQFKENSGIITSDNLYIFGGLNGFNCFRPSELIYNDILPQVMLADFYLFNKSADIHDPECPLKQSIAYTDHIVLNQKHHSFAFKFASSSYCDPSKNIFEYKLEPFDKEWQRTHGKSKLASYTNIPAGEYEFHVRTSNGQGKWSDEKVVKVTILPYWWLSWPMKCLYALIFIAIVAQFILRYRRKKKNEMRLFKIEKDQEVYESKMKFFTCMVHEIRTPLTLILGPLNSAMGKKELTVNDVLPDLQIIERNGRRLLSLVNQLMDFRKVEAKSYSVQLCAVNIKELIQQIAKDFHYYNVRKEIHFEYSMPEEECWANIDHEAFDKVFVNLLSNAVKFTNDTIRVSLVRSKDEKFWELSVEDNGKGIAIDEQTSIFDSFYQVHQDLPGDYVGTGIGLFVVRDLTELMGGTIRVESQEGQGAKFIASLAFITPPATVGAAAEKEPTPPQLEKEGEDTLHENVNVKKRLLIAEDNEEMRNYICSLFNDKYDINAFENGKLALEATKEQNYDLVITDLMMPIMDGMALCRTLKQQAETCHIPIIILTAKDDETSQKEGFESEADMYVTKPFSAEILQSRVKSILKNREHLSRKFYSEPETTADVLYTNNSDKEFLEKLDELINQKLSDCNLPVNDLAAEMAMGRSVFYQKVKGVTGLTPNDYIRTFRLKKAVTLFQKGETRINEVCYRVGFSSPSYFTKRFTLQFGISPSDYLKKFQKSK